MPADMQLLLQAYPRESWSTHIGFTDKTRQWLKAHQMFRHLSALVKEDAERFLGGHIQPNDYINQLVYRGGVLVSNLHGHHGWEDRSYFPELSAADPRFDAGLEILEKDHLALNQVLDNFVASANRAIAMLEHNDDKQRAEVGSLLTAAQSIESLLDRHLGDEEELAVPIILHYRLRG